MVDESFVLIIQKYLLNLRQQDIPVSFGVVFGSQARGEANKMSDIDLLVISPSYDAKCTRADVNLLWRLAARIDSRIEPIPVGREQFINDDASAIIEIARLEGQIIPLAG
jgi:predicted nucleotidyltransferase